MLIKLNNRMLKNIKEYSNLEKAKYFQQLLKLTVLK